MKDTCSTITKLAQNKNALKLFLLLHAPVGVTGSNNKGHNRRFIFLKRLSNEYRHKSVNDYKNFKSDCIDFKSDQKTLYLRVFSSKSKDEFMQAALDQQCLMGVRFGVLDKMN